MPVRIKRVYEAAAADDGTRILVDRLWPRGISKEKASFETWMKSVAPSTELRKWFDHKPERWMEFKTLYREELKGSPDLDDLRRRAATGTLTLLYGSRNTAFNHAAVLAELLKDS
ncbi:DUF488 domain-containing protein [Shinella curvata]|uniref:DUF488 domain-containing protein n=1 Tax=Shinella curvata TaxID=1817964 RepID=A0ABT8XCL6_9HYPH|nr:DUF488 domain-containing protein [Shinella curvata]MCJ8054458.1 DUF488 domain-containing protein [Shinella curvata]MDO6121479.1 DUF488 domain-containing protein [Shinella curvata]